MGVAKTLFAAGVLGTLAALAHSSVSYADDSDAGMRARGPRRR